MKIYLALTDDWELRGNGSGDIEKIQFSPMRKLIDMYERYDLRCTFNVEVMQQLTFRKLQLQHPELRQLADQWDQHVTDAFQRGHDIQLHVHPQWSNAQYRANQWTLNGKWTLPDYEPSEVYEMLSDCKQYLERLLRQVDPKYSCVAFRAGSSCIAPSKFALHHLASLGIAFDTSIVGGLRVNTKHVKFDYTNCEESFLPFYPQMDDARRVSSKVEPIVCVPIFQFTLSRRTALRNVARKGLSKVKTRGSNNSSDWIEEGRSSSIARVYDKAIHPVLSGKNVVGDLSQLDSAAFHEMLGAIRDRANKTGLRALPILLTNHTKYISDFSHIESFIRHATQAPDIEFITLREVADKLRSGEFAIKLYGHAAVPADQLHQEILRAAISDRLSADRP